ncbi:MAG: PAS domain S-box protein [Candidatus Zixiibacteriota bacterium]
MRIRDQQGEHKKTKKGPNLRFVSKGDSSGVFSLRNQARPVALALENVNRLFRASISWLFLVEEGGVRLASLAARKGRRNVVTTEPLPDLSARILKRTYPILCNQIGKFHEKSEAMHRLLQKKRIHKFIGVPLKQDGKLIGTLSVGRDSKSPDFTRHDLKSLAGLGAMVVTSLGIQVEHNLVQSEKFLGAIIESIPYPIFIKDRKHRWVILNQAISDLLGHPRRRMLGKSDYDFFPKRQADFFWKKDEEVFRTGRVIDVSQEPITDRRGKIHLLHTKKAPLRDSGGRITHLAGIIEDVTEHKRLESELIKRERIAHQRARLLADLRNLNRIEDVLTRVCQSVRDSGLFERAVMTLHRPGGKIVHLGHVGLPLSVVERARKAPPIDPKLKARITSKRYRISDSFFIPVETGIDLSRSGRHVPQQKRRESPGGDWQMGDELFVPLRDFSGEIMGYLSVDTPTDGCRPNMRAIQALESMVEAAASRVRDIEARKALLESGEKYRVLVENANEAIIVAQDGWLKFVNAKMTEIMGRSKQELLSKPFVQFIHPDDALMVLDRHRRRLEGKRLPQVYPFRIVDKKGRLKWLEINTVVIDWEGRPATLNFLSEITERKETESELQVSEEKYRTLVEAAQVGIGIVDAKQTIVFVNQACADLLGYTKEELSGRTLKNLSDQTQHALLKQRIDKTKIGESLQFETRLLTKEGKPRSVHISLAPLLDHKGSFKGNIGIISDLTEIKKAREYNILLDTSRALSQTLQFNDVLRTGADKAMEALSADRCVIVLTADHADDSTAKLRIYDSKNGVVSASVMSVKLSKERLSIYGRTLQARRYIPIHDARIHRMPELGKKILDQTEMVSAVIVPIILRKEMLGVFHVGTPKQGRVFSEEEIRLVQTMVNQMAVALRNCRLMEDAEKNHAQMLRQAEQLNTQYWEQKMLLELTQALSTAADLDQVLKTATRKVTELAGAERAAIALANPDGKSATLKAIHIQGKTVDPRLLAFTFSPKVFPQVADTLIRRMPSVVDDTSSFPRRSPARRFFVSRGVKSTAAIPLVSRDKTFGFLTVSSMTKLHHYTQEEITLLQTMCNPIAVTIENYLLLEDLKRQAGDLREQTEEKDTLLKISQALSRTMDLDEVVKISTEVVGSALEVDRCALLLATPNGDHLEVKGFFCRNCSKAPSIIGETFSSATRSKMRRMMKAGECVILDDSSNLPDTRESRKQFLSTGAKHGLAAGMFFGKKLVGVLAVSTMKESRAFTLEEGKLIQTIANQIAVAIENARLVDVVKIHTRELRDLSSKLMKVRENERKRIAQELHDEVGQMLQSMKMNLDIIKREVASVPHEQPAVRDWLQDTEKLLGQTIDQLRNLTSDLRPSLLDDFGLIPALKWFIDNYSKRSNVKVLLEARNSKLRFPSEIEIAFYRIAQEALTNVAKHARATEVSVAVAMKGSTAILSVSDNGAGFDASKVFSAPGGMGLLDIKERVSLLGGSFDIVSRRRKGTRLNINIPITEVKHEEGQIAGG